MREITSHKTGSILDNELSIEVLDEPGTGGAHHEYRIVSPTLDETIIFQDGPVKSVKDVNGISHETLLAIVIDRLQCFQKGEFSCRENSITLTKLEEALMWLKKRTEDRIARGVEGSLHK